MKHTFHLNRQFIILFMISLGCTVSAQEIVTSYDCSTQELASRKTHNHRMKHYTPRMNDKSGKKPRRSWGMQHDEAYELDLLVSTEKNSRPSSLTKLKTPPAFQTNLNFVGASVANAVDPLIIPPNLSGAVGETQYILMTYNVIRSFNKETGEADGILNIDAATFFGVAANDVRISYDRFSKRWFMSCEDTNVDTGFTHNIILAMSADSTITNCSRWTFFTIPNSMIIPQLDNNSGIVDYQQLAVDAMAVYISADTFNHAGYFLGTSTIVIPKSSLLSGKALVKVFPGLLPGSETRQASGITPPADNLDENPNYGYIINATNNSYPSGKTYNKLYFYRIFDAWSRSPNISQVITITVPSYADCANAPHKGNLFGPKAFLQTGGCNLTAPHVRNKQLYVCHCTQVDKTGKGTPKGDRVGIRWYQFDLTGDSTGQALGRESITTVPALVQSGTLYDDEDTSTPDFFFNPSIMTNKDGHMALGCSVSGKQSYPNAVFATRLADDEKGQLTYPMPASCSSNKYNFGPFVDPENSNIGQRWGDLSSMSVDPSNDLDIWSTQEFAAIENGWGVQVTQLKPFILW